MRRCRCHSLDTRSPCVLHLDALSVTSVTPQGIFVAGVSPINRTRVFFSRICDRLSVTPGLLPELARASSEDPYVRIH